MKKLMIGAVCAMMAAATFAEPKVEITKAYQAEPGSGIVNYTYTISGLKTVTDLYIKVGAEGCSTTKTLTFTNVKAGTVTAEVDVKTLLGQAYPNVTLVAELEDAVQLWENGPYFAKANVGATKPEESGYYFWWGGTTGYKRNSSNTGWVSAKTDSSFQFTSGNCQTYLFNLNGLYSGHYIDLSSDSGKLYPKYDAAAVHLGGLWRMPTRAELQGLVDNCSWEWKTQNGVSGYLITGKDAYSSNSIFLPAAGYGKDSNCGQSGTVGYCWSSSPSSEAYKASYLLFRSGNVVVPADDRSYGFPVRPVR